MTTGAVQPPAGLSVVVWVNKSALARRRRRTLTMLLLVLLAILAIVLFSAGFVVHWLFIVAVVVALLWVISLFTGGLGRRGARL